MQEITLKTPAYITSSNGSLYAIDLFDEIKIEVLSERKIQIEKESGYKIPTNHLNPVFKVASELQELRPNKFGARIIIQKNIPTFSGLNSQLSNAAKTLKVLNELWGFNLNKKELIAIAKKVDKKLPKLIEINGKEEQKVVLIIPKYIKFKKEWKSKEVFKHFPDLKNIKEILISNGATESEISGKGPGIYGFFNEKIPINEIKKGLEGKFDFIWSGKTINGKIDSNK